MTMENQLQQASGKTFCPIEFYKTLSDDVNSASSYIDFVKQFNDLQAEYKGLEDKVDKKLSKFLEMCVKHKNLIIFYDMYGSAHTTPKDIQPIDILQSHQLLDDESSKLRAYFIKTIKVYNDLSKVYKEYKHPYADSCSYVAQLIANGYSMGGSRISELEMGIFKP